MSPGSATGNPTGLQRIKQHAPAPVHKPVLRYRIFQTLPGLPASHLRRKQSLEEARADSTHSACQQHQCHLLVPWCLPFQGGARLRIAAELEPKSPVRKRSLCPPRDSPGTQILEHWHLAARAEHTSQELPPAKNSCHFGPVMQTGSEATFHSVGQRHRLAPFFFSHAVQITMWEAFC